MIKVGLTGSIGSGKSTIARMFTVLGTPVYIADIEAKKILNQAEVIGLVVNLAGEQVLQPNGQIDRKFLADKVFNDSVMLRKLNSIIHPRVREHFQQWVDNHTDMPYIIQEAAIIYESEFYKFFDKIIVVAADMEERISRVMLRDGFSREDVLARIENQWPQETKIEMADFVIYNSDLDLAIPQVLDIHQKLIDLSLIKKPQNTL